MIAASEYLGMVRNPWMPNQAKKKTKLDEIRQRLEGLVETGLGEPSGAYADARNRELASQLRTQAQLSSEAERRLSENLSGRGMTNSGLYKEGAMPIQEGRFGQMAQLQRGAATDIAGRESYDRAQAIQQAMAWVQSEQQRRERWQAGNQPRQDFKSWGIIGALRPTPELGAKRQQLKALEDELRQLMGNMPQVDGGAWGQPEADASTILPREPGEDWYDDLA